MIERLIWEELKIGDCGGCLGSKTLLESRLRQLMGTFAKALFRW